MTGAAALFPVMLFSTTEPARRLNAADCAALNASLIIGMGLVVPGTDPGLWLSLHHSAALLGQSECSQGQPRILLAAGLGTSISRAIFGSQD